MDLSLKNLSKTELIKILPQDLIEELAQEALKKTFKMEFQKYLKTNDAESSVTQFLRDTMILEDHRTPQCLHDVVKCDINMAYRIFKTYCQVKGLKLISKRLFIDEISDRGIPQIRLDGNVYFFGIQFS